MRPLEDFDLAQGALRLVELRGIGLENAIDDQRDRAFRIARAIDAANVHLRIASLCRAGNDSDARGQLREIVGTGCAGIGDSFGGEH